MTDAEKGSVVLAITLLARALANDSEDGIALAQTQLDAVFGKAKP